MTEWKKVFENNVSLYCRIIIQYLIKSGWKSISIEEYTKKMPDFPVKEAIQSKLYKKAGLFPIVSQSKDLISGFSDNEQLLNKISEPIIIFGDHTQVVKYIDFDFVLGADGTKILTATNDFNPKFFYYLIKSIDLHSNKYARHYSKLRKEKIPFQENSLSIQNNIVSFLDSLENNNISNESYFDKETEQKILSLQKNILNVQCLKDEIESQKNYIKQLRQNILQEAIEGKLTKDWRKSHPIVKGDINFDAEALFEQIQKEKPADKKQKKLSPITDEKKTFVIPDGWKWVKLGEIIDSIVYGTSEKYSYDDKQNSAILRIPNISSGFIDVSDLKYTNLSKTEKEELSLKENDLLVIRSNGSPEIVGKMVCVPKTFENYCYAGYLIRLRFIVPEIGFFIAKISNAKSLRNQIEAPLRTTVGINNINTDEIKRLKFPLPALAEQKEMITRIKKHLQTVSDFENQIIESEQLSKQLMQSILKDAFEEKYDV